MALSNQQIQQFAKRLFESRARVLVRFPFYGLLLTHINLKIVEGCKTAYTDGRVIAFDPIFLQELSDIEVDIVLMHEIMHIVLKHCERGVDCHQHLFNIACDIVANSNIKHSLGDRHELISIRVDPTPWEFAPNGEPGYKYTVEEVYEMLVKDPKLAKDLQELGFDNHGKWRGDDNGNNSGVAGKKETQDDGEEKDFDIDEIAQRVANAVKPLKDNGKIPLGVERMIKDLNEPKQDWRTILNNAIQEEVNDYSFCPPDRRFQGDFLLPDFNDTEPEVKNVLFMIDASGSMSQEDIKEMYSEVKGAVDQFNGKLSGKLGFFDSQVYKPKEFCSVEDLLKIKPIGGGGTSFSEVFKYIREKMQDELPALIIILTDGYDNFPKEEEAIGIPVVWIINSKIKAPWGKTVNI